MKLETQSLCHNAYLLIDIYRDYKKTTNEKFCNENNNMKNDDLSGQDSHLLSNIW